MPRTNARGRGQFFEAKSEAEEKILASRPVCPRGLNIQSCSLGLERLGLETVSRRFSERLGLVLVSTSYVSFT